MVIGSSYQFNYVKNFDTAQSNLEIFMQKTDKTFWTTKKERKRSWIFFRSFYF